MDHDAIELVTRARSGQREALGDLCVLFQNYLRVVARNGLGRKLRERVDLSDVVQEAMVEVVKQFPQFTGQTEAALVGWLRRLVGQKLADLGRYHGRVKRGARQSPISLDRANDPMGLAQSSARGLADYLASSQTNPSEVVSQRELHENLADALALLPEVQGKVIWLYHVEGLTFEGVGARLGVSRKAIRGIYAHGLKTLRNSLNGPPGGALHFERLPALHTARGRATPAPI